MTHRERLEKSIQDLEDTPKSLAIFDAALAEKDAEIERLREWKKIVLGSGTDQEVIIRLAASEYTKIAAECWKREYDTLLAQAVRFAEWCVNSGMNPALRAEAKAFLDQHRKGASHE